MVFFAPFASGCLNAGLRWNVSMMKWHQSDAISRSRQAQAVIAAGAVIMAVPVPAWA